MTRSWNGFVSGRMTKKQSEKLIELSELEQLVHSLAEIGGEFQRQFC